MISVRARALLPLAVVVVAAATLGPLSCSKNGWSKEDLGRLQQACARDWTTPAKCECIVRGLSEKIPYASSVRSDNLVEWVHDTGHLPEIVATLQECPHADPPADWAPTEVTSFVTACEAGDPRIHDACACLATRVPRKLSWNAYFAEAITARGSLDGGTFEGVMNANPDCFFQGAAWPQAAKTTMLQKCLADHPPGSGLLCSCIVDRMAKQVPWSSFSALIRDPQLATTEARQAREQVDAITADCAPGNLHPQHR